MSLIKSGDGLVILLGEIGLDEMGAGQFIRVVQSQGTPQPRAPFGAQSLLHVTKAAIAIEDALFHVVANRGVDHDPGGGWQTGWIDSLEIQFGKTGGRSTRSGHRDSKDVISRVPLEGEFLPVHQ